MHQLQTPASPAVTVVDTWRICIHESGHAIAARVLGLEVLEVAIGSRPTRETPEAFLALAGSHGRCVTTNPFKNHPERDGYFWLKRVCIMRAAGVEAERAFFRGTAKHGCHDADGIRHALKGVLQLVGQDDEDSLAAMELHVHRKAARLVRRHQKAVEALAERLMECGALAGGELSHSRRRIAA